MDQEKTNFPITDLRSSVILPLEPKNDSHNPARQAINTRQGIGRKYLNLGQPEPIHKLDLKLAEAEALPSPKEFTPTGEISIFEELENTYFEDHKTEYIQRFQDSKTIIFIAGTHGLGDALSWARAAMHLKEITGKKVIVQLPKTLHGLLNPELTSQEVITTDQLEDPDNFFISLDPFTVLTNEDSNDWIEPTQEQIEKTKNDYGSWHSNEKIRQLALNNSGYFFKIHDNPSFYEHEAVFGTTALRNIWQINFPNKTPNSHSLHSYYNLRLKMLTGVDFNPKNYSKDVLKMPPKEQLPEQDIDLLVMPDAKEGPDPNNMEVSLKMVPLDTLVESLVTTAVSKGIKKMAILKGVAHPEYCQELYLKLVESLKNHPTQVEFLSGELEDLTQKFIPRSKNIFFMDSVTAHLSSYAAEALKQMGRNVNLLQYYNRQFVFEDEYTIPGVKTFSTGNKLFDKLNIVLGSHGIATMIQYNYKRHLAYPTPQQIFSFLSRNLAL